MTLAEARLNDEGGLVLGLERASGTYLGAPRGQTSIEAGDTIILYGRKDTLESLDRRPQGGRGNVEHDKQVETQAEVEREDSLDDATNQQASEFDGKSVG
jgi:uncharacterized protein with PhoU and TrkA domain